MEGAHFGRYRIAHLVGEGATSKVYLARDALARDRARSMALKLLRAESDGVARARFLREARLARELHLAHVVPVVDVGEERGTPFLVMPFYTRGSLARQLQVGGPLGIGEAVMLAAQLGRGLDALHRRGVLHRDVKPSNVLLDDEASALLADFGLARAADSTRLTRDGQLLGTAQYLAPELIEGDDGTIASDIYALACLLYESFTGSPPFAGRRAAELGYAHLVEPPPDPRLRRPDLPEGIAQALLMALQKEPSARPTSATALAHALRLGHTAGPASAANG